MSLAPQDQFIMFESHTYNLTMTVSQLEALATPEEAVIIIHSADANKILSLSKHPVTKMKHCFLPYHSGIRTSLNSKITLYKVQPGKIDFYERYTIKGTNMKSHYLGFWEPKSGFHWMHSVQYIWQRRSDLTGTTLHFMGIEVPSIFEFNKEDPTKGPIIVFGKTGEFFPKHVFPLFNAHCPCLLVDGRENEVS